MKAIRATNTNKRVEVRCIHVVRCLNVACWRVKSFLCICFLCLSLFFYHPPLLFFLDVKVLDGDAYDPAISAKL